MAVGNPMLGDGAKTLHNSTGRHSLTYREWQALSSEANLSDGHARGWISAAHRKLVVRMPSIYEFSVYSSQDSVEISFLDSFYKSTGQFGAFSIERTFFYYSASVAIDAVFSSLARSGTNALGMITPTFDNLSALARGRNLSLIPLEERLLWDFEYLSSRIDNNFQALMIIMPNNPTGQEVLEEHFRSMAAECMKRRIALVVDASFRFFSRSSWDIYAVLLEFDALTWYVIEDTGKAVGLSELKVGFVNCDQSSANGLAAVTDDILLNVSPFVLGCLTVMLGDSVDGSTHLDELREVISVNRGLLRKTLHRFPQLSLPNEASTSSVEWIRVDSGPSGEALCYELVRDGVHVLPGGEFFWERQARGDRFLRLALARDPRYFAECVAQAIPALERTLLPLKTRRGFRTQGH